MPKFTLDGKELEVPAGTTVIQAALAAGIHVPHFCWHPDLPVDGNCRMCLVEIEKMPKLQIACNTQVTDGMVVRTNSEKAAQAHRTTLEFLLVNHPIDCPVCDQAGECYLQDQYMEDGLHDSRVEIEEKVRKRKVVDLGPIMLDAERCVLCSRCLRYESTVTGTNSFEFVNRGNVHADRDLREPPRSSTQYAGNLADVCPVGALLSHDFRFKMRVWFLKESESVCPGCSTGCNIYCGPARRRGAAVAAAPQRRGQQVVDVRPRPRPLQGDRRGLPRLRRTPQARQGLGRRRRGSRPRRDCLLDQGLGQYRCVPGFAPGHQRGPVRVLDPGGERGRAASTSASAIRSCACASDSTRYCSALTAIRTRRAPWISAWRRTASTRS